MSPRCKSCQVSFVVAAAITFLALPRASSALDAAPKRLTAFTAATVERAKLGATRRLRNPECLKLLTDFKDGSSRTLEQSLDTWRLSAADYLQVIAFEDGSSLRVCQRPSVTLVTARGLPTVYVCPAGVGRLNSRFDQLQVNNPALAEAMVIHEMLHTLGLGENPPTTFEITERVRERCR